MSPGAIVAMTAALLAACACHHVPSPLSTTVTTASGPIRGSRAADILSFKGIPYAAPPVGDLRWRPPVALQPWTEARDATEFAPQCIQPQRASPTPAPPQPMSEDCLALNIWTSASATDARLPVLVWIHGGNFNLSSGATYDGANLARRGIVVVSLNYRLGVIGFLAHPALTLESGHGVSGNYGLLDQIAALKWIRANIALFGGDPDKVTIAGQSAGGTSIADLTISPLAKGLFHQIIVQSAGGSFGSQEPFAVAEREGAKLGSDIVALRAVPAEALITQFPQNSAVSPDHHFYPIIDGYVVPENPLALLAAGKAGLPMMIGYNSDEGLFWTRDLPTDVAGYRAYVASWFAAGLVDDVLARYPAPSDAEVPNAVARFVTDFKIATPTAQIARGVSAVAPVYAYRFSRVSPANQARFGGAAHGVEVPYIFGALPADTARNEDRDHSLSEEMSAAWVRFVKTGNPNGDGLPAWPRYRDTDFRLIDFGNITSTGAISDNQTIEFFDRELR